MATMTAVGPSVPYIRDDDEEPTDRGFMLPRGFEFVDGQLQELNVSQLSSYMAGRVYLKLANFSDSRRLGWVFPEGTSYQCFADDPTRIRRADAAFHLLSKLTLEQLRTEGDSKVVPDLVVEVVSTHDGADEVNRKWMDWLKAGVSLVWVVHPHDRTIHAYTSPRSVQLFSESDILTAEPVLPEFRLPMGELFATPAD